MSSVAQVRRAPVDAVVVNSIIYSKPSFCSLFVGFGKEGETAVDKMADVMAASGKVANPRKTDIADADSSCIYIMSTTINGSIHHKISDCCDDSLSIIYDDEVSGDDDDDDDDDDVDDDDDSFIEFAFENHISESSESSSSDHDDDDEDDDDDSDSDDDAKEDNNVGDDHVKEDDVIDDLTNNFMNLSLSNDKPSCKQKKVRFDLKPAVHVMHAWNYAYRAARKGEWEMYARDRARFQMRIERTAACLNPILDREHRRKIYESRFLNPICDSKDIDLTSNQYQIQK